MECQAITKSGKQCSRKAEPNSNFCWQHQNSQSDIATNIIKSPKSPTTSKPSTLENKDIYVDTYDIASGTLPLMLKALQPAIISKVKNYAGVLGDFSKTFSENTNKRKVIQAWFEDIGVQTPFDEVTDKDISLLWPVYLNKISNAPAGDWLEKAIFNGLNPYLFHSRQLTYDGKIDENQIENILLVIQTNDENNIGTQSLGYLNNYLSEFMSKQKIRKGDTITLKEVDITLNLVFNFATHLIYDGVRLIFMDTEFIDMYVPSVPKSIKINEFPTTNYFSRNTKNFTQLISDVVYFDTTDTKIQLIKEYQGYGNYRIYQYITTGKSSDYEIWMYTELTDKNWKGILPFDGAENGARQGENFVETISNLIDNDDILNEITDKIENNQSLRVLFQQELVNY